LGLYDCFDAVILSEVEKVRKPSPAIYQRTLDALGLAGPECVFVDDHAGNLPPAEALGIRTIHHTTNPEATATQLDALLAPRLNPAQDPAAPGSAEGQRVLAPGGRVSATDLNTPSATGMEQPTAIIQTGRVPEEYGGTRMTNMREMPASPVSPDSAEVSKIEPPAT
ncbi:HAD family hydrolase, partial [Streptomyces sp. NPDC001700]